MQLKPIRIFVLFVASVLFLPILVEMGFNIAYGNEVFESVSSNVSAVAMLLGYIAAYAVTIYFARDYFKVTLKNLFKNISPQLIFFAFFAGLLFTVAIVELMILIEPPPEFGSENEALLSGTFLSRGVLILFTALLGPLVEEFVFRAYIFDAVKQKYSFAITAVFTSFIFMLPHMLSYYSYWPAAIILFCLGLLLAYFRKRHDSLLPCIVLHSTYNCGLLSLFFIAS